MSLGVETVEDPWPGPRRSRRGAVAALLVASGTLNLFLGAGWGLSWYEAHRGPDPAKHRRFHRDIEAARRYLVAEGHGRPKFLDATFTGVGSTAFLVETRDNPCVAVLFVKDGHVDPTHYPSHWFRWMVTKDERNLALMVASEDHDPSRFHVDAARIHGDGQLGARMVEVETGRPFAMMTEESRISVWEGPE